MTQCQVFKVMSLINDVKALNLYYGVPFIMYLLRKQQYKETVNYSMNGGIIYSCICNKGVDYACLPGCLLVCLSVSCFDWFLGLGITLSAAQLFMIIIEEILQRSRGNLTSRDKCCSRQEALANL